MRFAGLFMLFGGTLLAQLGEYGGPSILSRGGGGAGPLSPISLRPFINVTGLFTTGLSGGKVDSNGNLRDDTAYGTEVAAGAYGYHSWPHTVLGVNYRGDYRKYSRKSSYDSTNQFLVLGLTHQINRKIAISLREGAGTFTQNYGYLGTFGFYDPTFAQIPRDELFDTRTSYLTTMADLTYQRTARMSFNFGATGLIVRRGSNSLYGVTGAAARGDMAYRMTRRSTVGVDYFFTQYSYGNAYGSASMHSVGVNYSVQPSRWWTLAFRAAALRMEVSSLGTVPLDPVIAAILGRGQGLRAFYGVRTAPAYGAQLARHFRRATATIAYSRGAGSGNGLYATSQQNNFNGSYSYTGLHRWSLNGAVAYSTLNSVGQDIDTYRNINVGSSVSRALGARNFYMTIRFDARRYTTVLTRSYYSGSIGFAYSPGDLPLRLW